MLMLIPSALNRSSPHIPLQVTPQTLPRTLSYKLDIPKIVLQMTHRFLSDLVGWRNGRLLPTMPAFKMNATSDMRADIAPPGSALLSGVPGISLTWRL